MKNKGFTLIELLATVTILGILITIAYVGVSQYLRYTKNKTYEVFEKDITTAAENYLIDHSGELPKEGETITINVQKLTDTKYIELLKDPADKTKNCNSNSYVTIKRNADDEFSTNFDIEYTACLKCINYKSPSCTE